MASIFSSQYYPECFETEESYTENFTTWDRADKETLSEYSAGRMDNFCQRCLLHSHRTAVKVDSLDPLLPVQFLQINSSLIDGIQTRPVSSKQ